MKTQLLSGLFFVMLAFNSKAYNKDCWVDVYDKVELAGAHARIMGPANLPSLHNLNNENWNNRIESLSTGPKTQLIAYRQENFKEDNQNLSNHGDAIKSWGERPESYGDQEIQIGANHHERHLGELSFHRNINALIIKCLP